MNTVTSTYPSNEERDAAWLAAAAAVADVLIPPAEGRLSASQAGVPGRFLDQALQIRPDLADTLLAAVAEVASGTEARSLLTSWDVEKPEQFQHLFLLIRGAYFLNPRVLEALSYDGTTAYPLSDSVPADYLDLVADVLAAGPRYRPVARQDMPGCGGGVGHGDVERRRGSDKPPAGGS